MIKHLYLTYFKWNVATGDYNRYFSYTGIAPEYDIDMIFENITEIGKLNQQIEGTGDSLKTSDIGIKIANGLKSNLLLFDSNDICGQIDDSTFGILKPMLESAGTEFIIAMIRIYSEFAPFDVGYSHDPSLLTGDINTYSEYTEDYAIENLISLFDGYIEMNSFEHDIFNNEIDMKIIALDKLLSYINQDLLAIKMLQTTGQIVSEIKDKAPFLTSFTVENPLLGTFMWLVPKSETENIDLSTVWGITDSQFDMFSIDTNNNAKLISWSRGYVDGIETFYIKLKSGTLPYLKIEREYSTGTFTITAEATLPTQFSHVSPFSYFSGANFARITSQEGNQVNYQDTVDTIAPYDIGFTKQPYLLKNAIDVSGYYDRGSCFCSGLNTLVNSAIPISDGVFWLYRNGTNCYMLAYEWTGANYTNSGGAYLFTDAITDIEHKQLFWRIGWRRMFMLNETKDKLFCYPSPESGLEYARVGAGGKIRELSTSYRIPYYDTLGRLSGYTIFPSLVEGEIFCIGIHLGSGDEKIITNAGTDQETEFSQYPIWYKDIDGVSSVVLGAKKIGTDGYSIDGTYRYQGTSSGTIFSIGNDFFEYYKKYVLENEIPSDFPTNPIFRYDGLNRLEMWYYGKSDKTLKCYNWKMELKYAYVLGVDFEYVALGLNRDNQLVVCFTDTNTNSFIIAEHTTTNQIYYPSVKSGTTASDILTDLAKFGFQSWWIERQNFNTKLFVKPRYHGTQRGIIPIVSHSYENQDYSATDSNQLPNRKHTREFWEKYADKINVKNTFGEIIIGRENSIYEFDYNFPTTAYNETVMQRIGNFLLTLLGKRRTLAYFPTIALRHSFYDNFEFYLKNWVSINSESDYSQALTTDIQAINLDENIYSNLTLLDCLLGGVFHSQSGDWEYDLDQIYFPTPLCYCNGCKYEYKTLMDAIMAYLNENLDFGTTYISLISDSEARSQIADLILANLDYTYISIPLSELLLTYLNCISNTCGLM